MIDYQEMNHNFYDSQAESLNFIRSWFHNSRNKKINHYVSKFYKKGGVIVDLGCGNVLWNYHQLPVIGVDVNEKFLDYNLVKGKISRKIASDVKETNLPDNSVNIAIITEVLEHLPDLAGTLKEIYRILRPGGIVISSVPYDTNLSLWKPLFYLQCFYRGKILGEQYYKEKCGHINYFSKKTIADLFLGNHFKIIEQYNHFFFTIFTIAVK